MKRKIFTTEEYREFSHSLRNAIESRKLTVTAAARILGVTRQSLHIYLRGADHQPRWRVLQRACRAWDISFVAQSQKFDKHAFGKEPNLRATEPVQLLLLPEAIAQLEDANVEVKIVGREPSRIYLEVQVRFAS